MVNYQALESFLTKRKNQGEENGLVFPENSDIAIGGVRKLNAAIMVFDIVGSSNYSDQEFIDYISPFLHMAFHIVNEQGGIVDKYTGDGAMISFCDKDMSDEEACEKSLRTALYISQLLADLNQNYGFPKIYGRIGLDFGKINVERIGVRGKTQLIIVGISATCAKRLESTGKQFENYDQYTTICIGYDFYNNLDNSENKFFERFSPTGSLKSYFDGITSMYSKKKPYPIYQYIARLRK